MAPQLYYLIFLIFSLGVGRVLLHISAADSADTIIFEDGYAVTTVFDGDKSTQKVNPQSVRYLHRHDQSQPSDLFVILDSAANALFTLSLPANSDETVVKRLAGNGMINYRDGDLTSAHFSRPRSFAVDYSGNVYVADHRNHAVRKISPSGVTTIAGGYSKRAGRKDGPGKNATFSDDFELTFIPERCALMIADRGNRLIRQISLKTEDCAKKSKYVSANSSSAWFMGLGISCLLGLIAGLVIRPYVSSPFANQCKSSSVQMDVDAIADESVEGINAALLRREKHSC